VIPKVIHQIWVGGELPDHLKAYTRTWREQHPGWRYRLWTDATLPGFLAEHAPDVRRLYDDAERYVPADAVGQFRSDLGRYVILGHRGGLYADTDTVCLKSMDPFLEGQTEWAAMEDDHWVGNTYMASEPWGTVIGHILSGLHRNIERRERGWRANKLTGPKYITPIWTKYGGALSPSRLFFPYSYNDVKLGTVPRTFDADTVAIHHWAHTRSLMETKK
jgi:mannosyltransferase OCH1-like enzyme